MKGAGRLRLASPCRHGTLTVAPSDRTLPAVGAPRQADPGPAVEVLPDQRALFAVPPDVAYFNTASLSPQLHSVREAGEAALRRRGEPWTITSQDWFSDVERLRGLAGKLLGGDPEGVALIPATSYGFAIAARNLPLRAGSRILVLADEYPSGIYTWRRQARRAGSSILTVRRRPDDSWTEAVLTALDERVSIVSVPNVHWTDGAPVDLAAIADRARDVGASLVVDASQSLGALPLDVGRVRPDFVIAVGYKWLLGPFGLGYLYVADEHRGGEPLEENWILRAGSEDFAALVDYRDEYQPGARRFDVGQRTNFEATPMAIAALEQLLAWGIRGSARPWRGRRTRSARSFRPSGSTSRPRRSGHRICWASRSRRRCEQGSFPIWNGRTASSRSGGEACGSPPTCTSHPPTSIASSTA